MKKTKPSTTRKGAQRGRPVQHESKVEPHTVYLTREMADYLKQRFTGLSVGVRTLVSTDMNKWKQHWTE